MLKEKPFVRYVLPILFLCLFISCLDPYDPPKTSASSSFLIVDGRIINGIAATVFRLLRSRSLLNDSAMIFETGASVKIESDANDIYEFSPYPEGVYIGNLKNLDDNKKYRLNIKTTFGKQYYSEWVELKKTPEIDSVTWEKKSDGVQIYTNTHDPDGKSKHYQYEFEETWKFRSFENSDLKFVNGFITPRTKEEQIHECFAYGSSSNIFLATSENLMEDIICKNPLTFVSASTTSRLSVRYSILVRQFAITKEAFQYWQNLKKITEDIGSLFDPQPSTLRGNIYCPSDENEVVLGFVSASNFTEKRIFIDRRQYGFDSPVFTGYEGCSLGETISPDHVPVYQLTKLGGGLQLFTGTRDCIDCTVRGSIFAPPYWQQ